MSEASSVSKSWAARLYVRAYADFGVAAPVDGDRWSYGVTIVSALVYVVWMAVFWLTLNIGTLPFGVFVEPLWRPNARFRLLKLPGGIPLIAILLPILLSYAAYNTYLVRGVIFAIGPFVLVAGAGAAFVGCFVGFNRARRTIFGRTNLTSGTGSSTG
jgi:hypothetical protein